MVPITEFLASYPEDIINRALALREQLLALLPGVTEQVDLPAKMIAYCYGQKYTELVCVILPSQKGLKLGFNRAAELEDPQELLEGTGKTTRYVPITSAEQTENPALHALIRDAHRACRERNSK